MFGQGFLEHLAVVFVVVEGADFGDSAKAFKSSEIELVDVGEMGICDDDIGQCLDVAQAVGYSTGLQHRVRQRIGGGVQTWSGAPSDSNWHRPADGTR